MFLEGRKADGETYMRLRYHFPPTPLVARSELYGTTNRRASTACSGFELLRALSVAWQFRTNPSSLMGHYVPEGREDRLISGHVAMGAGYTTHSTPHTIWSSQFDSSTMDACLRLRCSSSEAVGGSLVIPMPNYDRIFRQLDTKDPVLGPIRLT